MAIGISASALFMGGAALVGGGIAAAASSSAADKQAKAAANATALQKDIFEQQTEMQAPFRTGGLTAQNRLMTLLGLNPNTTLADGTTLPAGVNVDPNAPDYGKYARDFGMSDYQADPGYAFRLKEGLKALDAQAARRGGLISGAALKAANRYGQDYASNEYTNAFNRYQTNRSNQLQPLQSLMGAGQSATNATSNAAGAYGTNAGNNMLASANAQASGQIGAANAINNSIGTIGRMYNASTYGYDPYNIAGTSTANTYNNTVAPGYESNSLYNGTLPPIRP